MEKKIGDVVLSWDEEAEGEVLVRISSSSENRDFSSSISEEQFEEIFRTIEELKRKG